LHFASYNGHNELVKKIIELDKEKGELIESKNVQRNTPFDIAKNEKCKFWFRMKKKNDEDKLKKEKLEERKLKKLAHLKIEYDRADKKDKEIERKEEKKTKDDDIVEIIDAKEVKKETNKEDKDGRNSDKDDFKVSRGRSERSKNKDRIIT
jgi:hypothetical protein